MAKTLNRMRILVLIPSQKALTIIREKAFSREHRIHIMSVGVKWAVKKEGASRALRVVDTKDDAYRLAKNLIRKVDAKEVICHKYNGSFIRFKSA